MAEKEKTAGPNPMLAFRWLQSDKDVLEKAAKACDLEPRELLRRCFYTAYKDEVRKRMTELHISVEEFLAPEEDQ